MPCGDLALTNSVVLITGGGSGINFAFSKLVFEAGAKILIADLTLTEDARKFVASVPSEKVTFVKCDVTRRADLENLIKASRDTFGTVPDVYVAGAGVFEPDWSTWWDDTEDDGYKQLDINATHPMKLTRIATKALLSEQKKGVILILASLAGFLGTFSAPLYCASKHAVIGFVRSMADLDCYANIRVHAIAPGMVQTPLWLNNPEKMSRFGYDPKTAVTAETVAKAMIDTVINGKYQGGESVEITVSGTRVLGTWNLDPPSSSGTSVPQEVIDKNHAPLMAILDKERGPLKR
ncbi:hypothetical protein EDD37DRAFT_592242 [Exophiala viscosa]|uniref:uncharacterized protein n=1 Tax=Exophiala viscosa TaxID=2486360 RepID=UPI0021A24DD5|nr:hypothetical protein EDD37DRAFT_592242 [Exophiala viscosa]